MIVSELLCSLYLSWVVKPILSRGCWRAAGLLVLLLAVLAPGLIRAESPPVTVRLDGEELSFDVPAQIINGRTMVPFRKIFEALGAQVDYNPNTREVHAVHGETTLKLTIDSNIVEWRRSIIQVDVAPVVIEGRTLVPLRFVGQALGIHVDWDGAARTVILQTEPYDQVLARGIKTVHMKGCMVCHAIHGAGGNVAPGLNGVTDRYSREWLRTWLRNPQAVREGSRMPNFRFTEEEIEGVIRFLETAK